MALLWAYTFDFFVVYLEVLVVSQPNTKANERGMQ
jgi:hypothetical protein